MLHFSLSHHHSVLTHTWHQTSNSGQAGPPQEAFSSDLRSDIFYFISCVCVILYQLLTLLFSRNIGLFVVPFLQRHLSFRTFLQSGVQCYAVLKFSFRALRESPVCAHSPAISCPLLASGGAFTSAKKNNYNML